MKEISDHIYEGALAFKCRIQTSNCFVIIASILLAAISFIVPTTHI